MWRRVKTPAIRVAAIMRQFESMKLTMKQQHDETARRISRLAESVPELVEDRFNILRDERDELQRERDRFLDERNQLMGENRRLRAAQRRCVERGQAHGAYVTSLETSLEELERMVADLQQELIYVQDELEAAYYFAEQEQH